MCYLYLGLHCICNSRIVIIIYYYKCPSMKKSLYCRHFVKYMWQNRPSCLIRIRQIWWGCLGRRHLHHSFLSCLSNNENVPFTFISFRFFCIFHISSLSAVFPVLQKCWTNIFLNTHIQ